MVEFDAAAGLNAYFELKAPLLTVDGAARGYGITSGNRPNNATKLPMMEVSPGHYVGYFTIPSNISFAGAQLQVTVVDAQRYASQAVANGRLWINVALPE
jgi:bacillopeptidase F